MPPIFTGLFGYYFAWGEFICGFILGGLIIGGVILAITGVKAFNSPNKLKARNTQFDKPGRETTIYLGKPGKLALGCGTSIILLVPLALAVVFFSMVFLPEETYLSFIESLFHPGISFLYDYFILVQVLGCLFQLFYLGLLVLYLVLIIKNETITDTRKVVFAAGLLLFAPIWVVYILYGQ